MRWISRALVLLSAFISFTQTTDAAEKGSYVEFLFYSAPYRLDWSGPSQLVQTTVKNITAKVEIPDHLAPSGDVASRSPAQIERMVAQLEQAETNEMEAQKKQSHPHPISHINVRIQCGDAEPVLVGATGIESNSTYLRKLLLEGAAMETLVENTRGKFSSAKNIANWLPYMRSSGWMHSLSYQISGSLCAYLKNYVKTYEASRQNLIYGGLASNPLTGTGAGCAAFGMSVLKVSGLYEPEFDKQFARTVRIPHETMNLPGRPARYGFIDLLTGDYKRWARADEPHMRITFWDPQLMYDWVQRLQIGRVNWNRKHNVITDGKSIIVQVDARNQPAPQKPFAFTKEHQRMIDFEVNRLWGKK